MSKTTYDWSALGKQRLMICPRYFYSVLQPKTLATMLDVVLLPYFCFVFALCLISLHGN